MINRTSDDSAVLSSAKRQSARKSTIKHVTFNVREETVTVSGTLLKAFPSSVFHLLFPQEVTSQDWTEFSSTLFLYVLSFYRQSKTHFLQQRHDAIHDAYVALSGVVPANPLVTKQGILSVQEDLNYFVLSVPPPQEKSLVKQKCQTYFTNQIKMFDFLTSTFTNEEQRLTALLCQSGYSLNDTWGWRSSGSNKTHIISVSLLSIEYSKRVQIGHLWTKPLFKCWWDKAVHVVDNESVTVWCRRSWSIEFNLI